MRSSITLICLMALAPHVGAGEQDGEDKWYVMGRIGYHHHGEPDPVALDKADAAKYFTKEKPFLSDAYRKEVLYRLPPAPGARSLQARSQAMRFSPKDPRCFAEVFKFNSREVYIKVLRPLGAYRWHHHFNCLAIYRIERSQLINSIFAVDKLYEKFSFVYRGLGHGTSWKEASAILGKPDYRYPSQSPSLGKYYYRKHDLHVKTHNGQVHFLEKGKPEWAVSQDKEKERRKREDEAETREPTR